MRHRTVVGTAILLSGALGAWLVAWAGPIDPPAGAVSATYKTLGEVEPRTAINATNTPGDAESLYRITQPGSYYLTGSLTGVVGKHGIVIAASDVTLDLMGFDLRGVAGMGAFDGVTSGVASLRNITVINGSITGWGGDGVDLATLAAQHVRLDGVRASDNAGRGIRLASNSTLTDCSATANLGDGISVLDSCSLQDCTASSNGIWGIVAASGCSLLNCVASLNGNDGINALSSCTLLNCSAYDNAVAGINTFNGGSISNCAAFGNTVDGVYAGIGTTVTGCTLQLNGRAGISCESDSLISGNTCDSNTVYGIYATDERNRIEGNNCTRNARGIQVEQAHNIIIRNTCAGPGTPWLIAAGNVFGPIIDRRVPASPAVIGFSAAGTMGTTDPNANISY